MAMKGWNLRIYLAKTNLEFYTLTAYLQRPKP